MKLNSGDITVTTDDENHQELYGNPVQRRNLLNEMEDNGNEALMLIEAQEEDVPAHDSAILYQDDSDEGGEVLMLEVQSEEIDSSESYGVTFGGYRFTPDSTEEYNHEAENGAVLSVEETQEPAEFINQALTQSGITDKKVRE